MSKWQSMENAPEDNTILLDVGLPFPVVGCWSPVENSWLYANLGIDLYLGRWEDCYFESEFESKPHAWMPLPEMQKRNMNEKKSCNQRSRENLINGNII